MNSSTDSVACPPIALWICDDDDNLLRALGRALVRPLIENGTISDSATFSDAYYLWKAYTALEPGERPFIVMVSDLEMPRMTGSELVAKVINLDPAAEIFIMTGAVDAISTPKLKPCEVLGWEIKSRRFCKPFDLKSMMTAVEGAVRSIQQLDNLGQDYS